MDGSLTAVLAVPTGLQRIGRPPARCVVVGNSNHSIEAAQVWQHGLYWEAVRSGSPWLRQGCMVTPSP